MADPRQARIAGVTNVKTVSDTNSITTRAINVNNIAPSPPPLLLTAWGRLDPDPHPVPTINNANRDQSTDVEMNNSNSSTNNNGNKVNDINNSDINNSDINNRNNRNTKID